MLSIAYFQVATPNLVELNPSIKTTMLKEEEEEQLIKGRDEADHNISASASDWDRIQAWVRNYCYLL